MHLHVGYFIYTIVESDSADSRLLRKKLIYAQWFIWSLRDFLKKFPIHLSIYLSIYQMYKCDWVSVLWWSLSLVFVFFFRSIFFQFLFYLLSLFARVLFYSLFTVRFGLSEILHHFSCAQCFIYSLQLHRIFTSCNNIEKKNENKSN